MKPTMRLGLYHEPIHTDGRSFDTYGPFARYVLGLAKHFERVILFAPTSRQPTYFSGVPLDAPNLTIVPLPYFLTHIQALRHAGEIIDSFRRHCREIDVIIARGTAPLAYILWLLTASRRVPFIYHFASDPFEVIKNSPKYKGIYRMFALTAYNLEFQIQKFIVRRNYSFTSGEKIYRQLRKFTPNVEPIITSSLQQEDYFQRDDTCQHRPVKLLYVGYLRSSKGVEYLLEALRSLRESNHDVELELIGEGQYKSFLEQKARQLAIMDKVHFRGFAVMGPELNAFYNSADIFVLPSISEGSPKVVLEAMGHSLPVVATNVGNIPEMLAHGRRGILVPPADSSAIAQAVLRIINDTDFRKQCIQEGYEFARNHNIDTFIDRIAQKARQLVLERQRMKEK